MPVPEPRQLAVPSDQSTFEQTLAVLGLSREDEALHALCYKTSLWETLWQQSPESKRFRVRTAKVVGLLAVPGMESARGPNLRIAASKKATSRSPGFVGEEHADVCLRQASTRGIELHMCVGATL